MTQLVQDQHFSACKYVRHPMERWHTRAHLVNTYGCMTQRRQRGDISANLILYCESLELVEVT